MSSIKVYCDGACSGNPGAGAWGSVVISGEQMVELSGFEAHTTNNRMELIGAIESLKYLKNAQNIESNSPICIYTDSLYVQKGITEWIGNWRKKQWKGSNNQTIKNVDLWLALDDLNSHFSNLIWYWVRGHSGDYYNEIADKLAKRTIANHVSDTN